MLALVPLWALRICLVRKELQPFDEAATWSIVVVSAFVGWGSLVKLAVARSRRVDIGLRAAWGASAMAFVGGVLMVPSKMGRDAAALLTYGGAVLCVLAAFYEHERVRLGCKFVYRCARREPRLALLALVPAALVAIHYLGGVADWRTDPYDDDIAYLSFVKKLLDTGSFPEPFSFRRLGALGGQTFFAAVVGLRAGPYHAHTFDRSICVLLCVLLVVGHRVHGRRPSFLFAVTAALLVPTLPLLARNTAANYSAIAFFIALYRTVVWVGEREAPAWKSALPIALAASVTCTLRQNYLVVTVIFLALSYLSRAWRTRGLRARLEEPAWAIGLSVALLAPWMIASWQSNGTPLYPLVLGTFNPALQMQSTAVTFAGELRALIATLLVGIPLPTLGVFVLAAVLLEESDPRRPLFSFLAASAAGLVLLVHAINTGDPENLGRYAWAFVVAFAIAVLLTTGLARFRRIGGRAQLAAALALFAALVPLSKSVDPGNKFYVRALQNIDQARAVILPISLTRRHDEQVYEKLQAAVPKGERIAVLLDEPHLLDYARNPIWNLDMPGYSSLPPKMPFFLGSEKVEEYLRGVGVRYVAFVRSDRSGYHYRRDYWLKLLVEEMDIWRAFAPYVIDLTDNLLAISERHRRLFDADGNIVVDLGEPR